MNILFPYKYAVKRYNIHSIEQFKFSINNFVSNKKMISSSLQSLVICFCYFTCLMAQNTTTTQQQGFTLSAALIGTCIIIFILSIPVMVVMVLVFVDILKRMRYTNYECEEPEDPIQSYIYQGDKYPGKVFLLESNSAYSKKEDDEIQPLSEEKQSTPVMVF